MLTTVARAVSGRRDAFVWSSSPASSCSIAAIMPAVTAIVLSGARAC